MTKANLEAYIDRLANAKVIRFEFSLDAAACDGVNTVLITPRTGQPQQIVWAEIECLP